MSFVNIANQPPVSRRARASFLAVAAVPVMLGVNERNFLRFIPHQFKVRGSGTAAARHVARLSSVLATSVSGSGRVAKLGSAADDG